jgi:hypothetical protein
MIKFTTENGSKLRIDPDDIAAVSSTSSPGQAEIMLLDGKKVRILGTVADVLAELEKDADGEDV